MKKLLFVFLSISLGFFLSVQPVVDKPALSKEQKDTPKNVILLIGDGMGIGQMEIARLLEHGVKGKLFMETLPYTAIVHTSSSNNRVTDSAAGGTALAIGQKTNNGMIGITPNGKNEDSILDIFKKEGKRTAIITTNSVTDATPASFTASVNNRWADQEEIAKQQLSNKVDIIMGGGKKYFTRKDKRGIDLIDAYKNSGYRYISTADQLKKTNSNKILGLFGDAHLNFQLDRELLKTTEPTLQEMTKKTLDILSKDEKGFFAMIEGGRIDHASHASDITGIWKETIAFDEVVKYCVEWANKQQDTLVVVAADHETMGVSATEAMDINALKNITASPHYMAQQLTKKKTSNHYTEKSIRKVFKDYAAMDITNEELAKFQTNKLPKKEQVYREQQIDWQIGSIIANHYHGGILQPEVQQLSTTGGHTSNMIVVFAFGMGAEEFHGVLDNTDIPKKIASIMGYPFAN
ncbi:MULTISPECIES: alkaline phosphatase [Bacillaceae]|uniref:alkaline phosphatase n=1 Tax=Bacillaceae TaxID=186817 RepID=UPI001F3B11B2|nr:MULTISPECIES: alkaline phosphatase [Bacillaceae]MCF2646963.1 alkaline phosphatase [Niallia circulans]CAI9388840.1 Alkaline phosphatase 4 [Bacillus sp. T2.9-1]